MSPGLPAFEFPPVRVGNAIVPLTNASSQTGFQQRVGGIVVHETRYANGYKEEHVVSNPNVVKIVIFGDWPYVLTNNGRLFAADQPFKQTVRMRTGGFMSRAAKAWGMTLRTRFFRRLGWGGFWAFAFWGLTQANIALHGGVPEGYSTLQPIVAPFVGFTGFYLIDTTWAALRGRVRPARSSGTPGTRERNIFTNELLRNVKDITPNSGNSDFIVSRTRGEPPMFLSELAPAYATDFACVKALSRIDDYL